MKGGFMKGGFSDSGRCALKAIRWLNPLNPDVETYKAKAQDYRAQWPWLTLI